jgi:hypothetical protein
MNMSPAALPGFFVVIVVVFGTVGLFGFSGVVGLARIALVSLVAALAIPWWREHHRRDTSQLHLDSGDEGQPRNV